MLVKPGGFEGFGRFGRFEGFGGCRGAARGRAGGRQRTWRRRRIGGILETSQGRMGANVTP